MTCGLCCNGVIFADVRLQAADLPALKMLARGPFKNNRAARIPQPCPAFDGCRCRIYAERPSYCRQFECLLLKRVMKGTVKPHQARKSIRVALEGAGKVKTLLRAAGDTDEQLALRTRFNRTAKRLEERGREMADTFARLSVAMHELNFLLAREFYPGD